MNRKRRSHLCRENLPLKSLRSPGGTSAEPEGVNVLRRGSVHANVCHNSSAAAALSELTSVSLRASTLLYTHVQSGDSEAALNISFCFLTLKAGLTLPVVPFVNITHDSVKGHQNSPPRSFHMDFSHMQLGPGGTPSRSLPAAP